jgi:glycosyltransferase involved in cell wall biosynthesis
LATSLSKSKPKILYVVTEDWYFWSHRLDLARAAGNNGFKVVLATKDGVYGDKIRNLDIELYPVTIHRSISTPFRELGTIFKLARLYRKISPDIVHHIALKPIFAGSIASLLAGVPVVINTYTGLGHVFSADTPLSRFFIKLIVPFMSLVLNRRRFYSIVQNPDDHDLLLELKLVRQDNMTLIPGSGVDTNVFHPFTQPAHKPSVVMFASRLLKDKGILDFVEAARISRRERTEARFVIVGKIDRANPSSINQAELEDWIEEGVIEWWGYSEDMSEIFKQADIVCLPSFYREGIPKVLLEAASCGLPIVTTDTPGCREIVQDGVNGILVPVKDPASLANAIKHLLVSPGLRKKMGEAGRSRVVENYSINIINSATIGLYKKFCHVSKSE